MQYPVRRGADRVTIALSLSPGASRGKQDGKVGGVRVLHRDVENGIPGGLGISTQGAPEVGCRRNVPQRQGRGDASCPTSIDIRTSLVTVGDSEGCTLPYAEYIEALADRVASTLLDRRGAELLTVAHGPSGSGKTTQLFGASIPPSPNDSASRPGLLPLVLQRIFAPPRDTTESHSPVVAISVVEWRPCATPRGTIETRVSKCQEGLIGARQGLLFGSTDYCGRPAGDEGAPSTAAVDLLARVPDASSPTGCFMEDYADIPATRYVLCSTVDEAYTILHEAFRFSSGWAPVDKCSGMTSATKFKSQSRAAEVRNSAPGEAALHPMMGADSHMLVTILFRPSSCSGYNDLSILRFWDLCGPSPLEDDDYCSAFSAARFTHTSLLRVPFLACGRVLRGSPALAAVGRSADDTRTSEARSGQVSDLVGLTSTMQSCLLQPTEQSDHGLSLSSNFDSVSTMIGACVQSSCSSVVWVGALRRDSCFDGINRDVLRIAEAVSEACGDENADFVGEVRRQRRQENLRAAERVIGMFAVPFHRRNDPHFDAMRRLDLRGTKHGDVPLATPTEVSQSSDVTPFRHRLPLMSPVLTPETPSCCFCVDRTNPTTPPRRSSPLDNADSLLSSCVGGAQTPVVVSQHLAQVPTVEAVRQQDSSDKLTGCSAAIAPRPGAADTSQPATPESDNPGTIVESVGGPDHPDISRVSVNDAPSIISQRESEGVALVLQRVLEHPLSQLQEVSEHYKEHLRQQRRVVSNISALFHSSSRMFNEARRQEQQQERLLAAMERNAYLEERLRELERENGDLRTQLSVLQGHDGAAAAVSEMKAPATSRAIADTLRQVIMAVEGRTNDVTPVRSCDKVSVGVQTVDHREGDASLELPHEAKKFKHQAKGCYKRQVGVPFANTSISVRGAPSTDTIFHTENVAGREGVPTCLTAPQETSAGPGDHRVTSSHLLNVLMRATKVVPSANNAEETASGSSMCQGGRCGALGLPSAGGLCNQVQVFRRGEVSITSDESSNICAELRAFREAVTAAREGALKALRVAKEVVRDSCAQSLSSCAVSACNGDVGQSTSRSSEGGTSNNVGGYSLRGVWEELTHQEAKVGQALNALQREAIALEQSSLEALCREKQSLSRVVFAH